MSDDALRYFQSYGTIISQKVSNSNWMHIQYETVDQANEAVGANGRPHEALGGYMIGVKRCSEAVRWAQCGWRHGCVARGGSACRGVLTFGAMLNVCTCAGRHG